MNAPDRPARLQVGGTLVPERDLYIPRPEDEELFATLREREYVNIVSSRQVGKSSAMVRAALRLQTEGWRFAVVDLTSLGTPPDADAYFQGLVKALAAGLKLKQDMLAFWAVHAGDTASQRLIAFFRDIVLAEISGPVAVFLDEIDSTLKLSYTDDLFTALRAIYNERTLVEAWRRLVFCLVGVATPNELVKDRRTTPYNVGRTVWVGDFDPARDSLGTLATALQTDPVATQRLLARILYWTGGHPFLTMRLVKEAREASVADASGIDTLVVRGFARLERLGEDVHVQSILRFVAERFTDGGATLALYERILAGVAEPDQAALTHVELKLSGLVRRGPDGRLAVRNRIYARLFDQAWVRALRPLRAARRYRGIAIAAGLALLLTVGGGTAYYQYSVNPEIAGLESTVQAREALQRLNVSLGEDAQGRLTVSFPAGASQATLTDAVQHLSALRSEKGTPRVLTLNLSRTNVTDFAPLAGLVGIEQLNLSELSLENLATLPSMPHLRELDLSGASVRDLAPLARFPTLESLDLGSTPPENLATLPSLPELRELDLSGSQVRDLSPLVRFPTLVSLDLGWAPVQRVDPLIELPQLRRLVLAGTEIEAPLTVLPATTTSPLVIRSAGGYDILVPGAEAPDHRAALVIGNADYQSIAPLATPKFDAEDMAAILSELGFHVFKGLDISGESMTRVTRAFARRAEIADIAMTYYSGRGMQFKGTNYLIPIDGQVENEHDLRDMVELSQIIRYTAQAKKAGVVIVDACRDNPFPGDVPLGLAQPDLMLSPSLVAYATAAGAVAYDGNGSDRNSVFTAALLQNIKTPNLDLSDLFLKVSADVRQATRGMQLPTIYSSLDDRIYLVPGPPEPVELEMTQLTMDEVLVVQRSLNALGFWSGAEHGAASPELSQAVRIWQRSQNSEESGRMSPQQLITLSHTAAHQRPREPLPELQLDEVVGQALAGDLPAQRTMGMVYDPAFAEAEGFGKDRAKAQALYEKAASLGDVQSARLLGTMLVAAGDSDAGIRWLETASKGGDSMAALRMAELVIEGEPKNAGYAKAVPFLKIAAANPSTRGIANAWLRLVGQPVAQYSRGVSAREPR